MLLSKRKVDLVSILVPILTVAFISSERTGFWDRVRGLDLAERAAKRFDLSYAADASTPVRVGDPEWRPLLSLIEAYSIASLPKGREPRVIARHVAIASAKTQIGPDQIMEWTAPSTPLLLLYRDWPGDDLPPSDVKIVGTIGDLHRWIDQSKADFHSDVVDFLLTITGVALALAAWRLGSTTETRSRRVSNKKPY